MPHWLSARSWFWDAERRRHVLVLRNHVVQIVARKGIDWTWRVERMDAPGLVSTGGFGFQTASEARRDVLAEFWSDLWDGRMAHEQWRRLHAQRPLVERPVIIASRAQWAAEVEAGEMLTRARQRGTR
jgi:hypothetical protein